MVFLELLSPAMTRILLIDDNPRFTTLMSKALTRFGYDPIIENHSLRAMETVRRVHPALILLDVMMPDRDGGSVLSDLRHDLTTREIPVILVTGIAREAASLADMGGIVSPVLEKPVNLSNLLREIEIQLATRRTGPSHGDLATAHPERAASRDGALHHAPPPLPRGTEPVSSFFTGAASEGTSPRQGPWNTPATPPRDQI